MLALDIIIFPLLTRSKVSEALNIKAGRTLLCFRRTFFLLGQEGGINRPAFASFCQHVSSLFAAVKDGSRLSLTGVVLQSHAAFQMGLRRRPSVPSAGQRSVFVPLESPVTDRHGGSHGIFIRPSRGSLEVFLLTGAGLFLLGFGSGSGRSGAAVLLLRTKASNKINKKAIRLL